MRLLALACVLLLSSCGGGTSQGDAPPVDAPGTTSLPAVGTLDGLKASSWLDGTTAPAALPLACDGASLFWDTAGAGLNLGGAQAAGPLAYAIYRLAAPSDTNPRVRAYVAPGVWLLVADYGRQRWHVLAQATAAVAEYSLADVPSYTSPGNHCYIAVVQEPGQLVQHVLDIAVYSEYLEHPSRHFYYVDPMGSDNDGGSEDAPWQTLQHAADEAGTGCTVVVHAGEYAGFHTDATATASDPLLFTAEPGVVITSPNSFTGRDGINVENAAYVVLDGFTVTGVERAGIRVAVSEYVTVQNCRCLANGVWGIFTGFAEHLTLERNVCVASGEQHGIYTSNSGDYPTVRGNVLAGNSGCGLHMNGDISMGGDGIISHALVAGNVIFDNGVSGGSGINCDGVQDGEFVNNLLFDNHASGISLYQIDGGAPSHNNTIMNNTVVQADDGRWCMNIVDGSTGNTVRNNIFFTFHSWRGSLRIDADCLSGLDSDYNVILDRITTDDGGSVITLANWQGAHGQDMHSAVVAPGGFAALFPGSLLQLGLGSPARNAGSPTGAPATDICGTERPQGSGVDCGAWEYAE